MTRVVVIGCGWGQLAVALRMAARGWSVGLLCAEPGPPAFASLPNRVLVPAGLRELFGRTGAELAESVPIAASEPALTVHHPWGAPISLPGAGVGPAIGAVRAARGERSAMAWRAVIAEGSRTWSAMRDAGGPNATPGTAPPAHAPSAESLLGRVRNEPDPVVGMLAASPAILAGLEPGNTPPAGITLAYLEATFGVWHVVGGLGVLAKAVIDRLTELGATVAFDQSDVVVEAQSGQVVAVRTPDRSYPADLVVVGPDPSPDTCLELSLSPGPEILAPGAHVWFPSGLHPEPGDPLAIAGWIAPEDPTSPGPQARLVIRLPIGCSLTPEQTLTRLAAAGTDLRPALISATAAQAAPAQRATQLPAGEPAGLVSLIEVAANERQRMRRDGDIPRAHPNPAESARGNSKSAPIPWAAAGEAPWTGMVGQLLRAEALARSLS